METLMASSSLASTSAITCRSPIRSSSSTSFSSTSSCLLGTTQINRNPSFRIQFRPSLHLPRSSSSSSSVKVGTVCGITEINENQFSDVVLKSTRPVLVEFVAGWCGPCRLISPLIESIAQEYKEKLVVVKIDHDSNPKLIEEYKVYGLPALILFKDGQEIPGSRREGAITKAKLKVYVDALLESVSVA